MLAPDRERCAPRDWRVFPPEHLATFAEKGLETHAVEISGPSSLQSHVSECDVVPSAAPHNLTPGIALAARRGNAHYLDLTEDVDSAKAVAAIAAHASTAFIPQCGMAPGFISIVATEKGKGEGGNTAVATV